MPGSRQVEIVPIPAATAWLTARQPSTGSLVTRGDDSVAGAAVTGATSDRGSAELNAYG